MARCAGPGALPGGQGARSGGRSARLAVEIAVAVIPVPVIPMAVIPAPEGSAATPSSRQAGHILVGWLVLGGERSRKIWPSRRFHDVCTTPNGNDHPGGQPAPGTAGGAKAGPPARGCPSPMATPPPPLPCPRPDSRPPL